jgi:hypothetical protein
VGWINFALDKDQWRTRVNTQMNPRVPLKADSFLTSLLLLASQGLSVSTFQQAFRNIEIHVGSKVELQFKPVSVLYIYFLI